MKYVILLMGTLGLMGCSHVGVSIGGEAEISPRQSPIMETDFVLQDAEEDHSWNTEEPNPKKAPITTVQAQPLAAVE